MISPYPYIRQRTFAVYPLLLYIENPVQEVVLVVKTIFFTLVNVTGVPEAITKSIG
jgi:hypothetical protein